MKKLFFLLVSLSLVIHGRTQDLSLLKDINTQPPGSGNIPSHTQFVKLGTTWYFAVDDQIHGREIWRSDGTTGGTSLLKDINPGIADANLTSLILFKNEIYFYANDGVHGMELWKSDGTEAGTQMMKEFVPGIGGFNWGNLWAGNNLIFFFEAAYNISMPVTYTLWTSDGTAAGTHPVTMPVASVNGTGMVLNDKFVFNVSTGTGYQLWITDGTTLGTTMLFDNPNLTANANPLLVVNTGTKIFFNASDTNGFALWVTDGTVAGTKKLSTLTFFGGWHTAGNDILYFAGNNGTSIQLWKSDGTVAGTVAITQLSGNPGVQFPFSDGTDVYFSATDSHGYELWKADGTALGASLLKDIEPGSVSSYPNGFIKVNGNIYFQATTAANGIEGWRTDGTTTGTVMLKDIAPGTTNSSPLFIGGLANMLFFAFDNTNGYQFWKSDGTGPGTVVIKKIIEGTASSSPFSILSYNNNFYFLADDFDHGLEIWKSDGTRQGTQLLTDLNPTGVGASALLGITSAGFLFRGTGSPIALWRSDGTVAGTVKLKDNFFPLSAVQANSAVYILATNLVSSNSELWKSDGTVAGTALVKVITPPGSGGSYSSGGIYIGSTVYFVAFDAKGAELWKSSVTGTVMVKDILVGSMSSAPIDFTAFNGKVIFSADDGVNGRELWISDGSSTGTMMIKDIQPGAGSANPNQFTVLGSQLYFTATNDLNGYALWKSDGTVGGTTVLSQMTLNNKPFASTSLVAYNGNLFFASEDAVHGLELWKSDGVTATLFADLNPGVQSSDIDQMRVVNDKLFFIARDASGKLKLWISDGTAANTKPLNTSIEVFYNLEGMTFANNHYLFWSKGVGVGLEMYTLSLDNVTGLSNESPGMIEVYPNPGTGTFYVSGELAEHSLVTVIDLFGRIQAQTSLSEKSFQIHSLPAGLYFVRIQSGTQVITKKVIKN